MEVTELTLWVARLSVLVLMYILVLVLVFALRADARAVAVSRQRGASPSSPKPAPAQVTPSGVRGLVVTGGTIPTTGREYQLFGPLVIGRGPSCNVTIQNNFVSTMHARVYTDDGRWMVEDLGSTNGTVLNGKPLQDPEQITPGDQIFIGDTVFLVR